MDLELKEVADLLSVSESTIQEWVDKEQMPAYHMNEHLRFNCTEVEDWMLQQNLEAGGKVVAKQGMQQFSLFRAIHRGGVFHNVPGETKEEVIQATTRMFAERLELDSEVISDLLLDRERLMPTSLNNGIGVPHTRDFLLQEHFDVVVVAFPEKELDYGSLDGEPVHSLFFLFASEDKKHLHLLAKLAHLSGDKQAQEVLRSKPSQRELLEFIKNWERTLVR